VPSEHTAPHLIPVGSTAAKAVGGASLLRAKPFFFMSSTQAVNALSLTTRTAIGMKA